MCSTGRCSYKVRYVLQWVDFDFGGKLRMCARMPECLSRWKRWAVNKWIRCRPQIWRMQQPPFCHKKKATSSITYHIIMTASQCGACWLNESPSAKNTPASEYIWESIQPASCVRESNTSPVGSRRTLQAALFSRAFCRVPSCFRFTRVITELDHWADRVTLQTALSLAGRWPASFTTEELSEAGKYVSYLGASSSQSSWRLL